MGTDRARCPTSLQVAQRAASRPFQPSHRFASLLAGVGVALLASAPSAGADLVDPFDLVPRPPEPNMIGYSNPHPQWGDVLSCAHYDNGNQLLVLWQNGDLVRYNANMSQELGAFGTAGNYSSKVGYVPTSFGNGGDIAITTADGGVDFYDSNGNHKGNMGIPLPPGAGYMTDLDWDTTFNRALFGTDNIGVYAWLGNGQSQEIGCCGGVGSLAVLAMDPNYCDASMFAENDNFIQFNADGTVYPPHNPLSVTTGYGESAGISGLAFTITNGYATAAGFIVQYESAAFQDHMNYGVSRPCDLDGDGNVDIDDFELLANCMAGPNVACPTGCERADLDRDADVDLVDFCRFQTCFAP